MCPSRESDHDPVLTTFEREALLTEYQEMREEIRANISIMHQRVSRGIAAIGFVIGYALLAPGGSVFVSIVPILMAVLFFLTVQSIQDMSVVSRHAYDIEALVPVDEFGYEHRYGGLLRENRRTHRWSAWNRVDLTTLPGNVVIALSALVYGAFLYLGYLTVDRRGGVVGATDPALLVAALYAVLTSLVAVVSYAHLRFMRDLRPE
jgi:uncharacterized membrane protein (Fun14 family)